MRRLKTAQKEMISDHIPMLSKPIPEVCRPLQKPAGASATVTGAAAQGLNICSTARLSVFPMWFRGSCGAKCTRLGALYAARRPWRDGTSKWPWSGIILNKTHRPGPRLAQPGYWLVRKQKSQYLHGDNGVTLYRLLEWTEKTVLRVRMMIMRIMVMVLMRIPHTKKTNRDIKNNEKKANQR